MMFGYFIMRHKAYTILQLTQTILIILVFYVAEDQGRGLLLGIQRDLDLPQVFPMRGLNLRKEKGEETDRMN